MNPNTRARTRQKRDGNEVMDVSCIFEGGLGITVRRTGNLCVRLDELSDIIVRSRQNPIPLKSEYLSPLTFQP